MIECFVIIAILHSMDIFITAQHAGIKNVSKDNGKSEKLSRRSQLARCGNAIADSLGALQMIYLHTLVQIASEKNSTILFPLPMEIMRARGVQSFKRVQEQMAKEKRQAKHSDFLADSDAQAIDWVLIVGMVKL